MTHEAAKQIYRKAVEKKILFILLFCAIAAVAFLLTLGFGVYKISIPDAIMAFFNHLFGNPVDPRDDMYIWDTRLPRAIGALVVGAGLSLAGVIMQNDFKNPLAEPYTMGISSGAFFGAVIFLVLGISIVPFVSGDYALIVNAFITSLIPLAIIVLVSKRKKLTPTAMILTGIAIMFLLSSICQYIMVTAPSESLADAYSWRVGALNRITWESLTFIIPVTVVISIALWLFAGKLNVMYAGDKGCQTLGESAPRLRIITLALSSLLTATVVCFTGTIGFIGLVGPHVARIIVGSNNRYLIPASMAFGAAFILIADSIAKISGANGLPVGVISSMIGGPLFVYILIKQRKNAWA